MVSKTRREENDMRAMIARKKREEKAAKEPHAGKHKRARAAKKTHESQDDRAAKGELRKKMRAMVPAPKASSSTEPPYSFSIHAKRLLLTVIVTLHNVPPQHIDVQGTTSSKLLISTEKHTKKWRLEWEFPQGIKVDPEKAEYTFENGLLTCVLPIVHLPKEVQQEHEGRLQAQRDSRKARFEMSDTGGTVVRSRTTTLLIDPEGNKTILPRNKPSTKPDKKPPQAKGATAEENSPKEAPEEKISKKDQNEATKSKRKLNNNDSKQSKRLREEEMPTEQGASKAGEHNELHNEPPKKKAFVSDKAAALRIAQESAQKAKVSLKEKLERLRSLQQERARRASASANKKAIQEAKAAETMERIVAEKKNLLAEQERLAAPPKKKATASKKSVSFS